MKKIAFAFLFIPSLAYGQLKLDSAMWNIGSGGGQDIRALTYLNNRIYFAGNFKYVGKYESVALLDTIAGATVDLLPRMGWNAHVTSLVPDGHGGFFMSAKLDYINSNPCDKIVHIAGDGKQIPFDPKLPRKNNLNRVNMLAVSGDTLYAASNMTTTDSLPQRYLAAYSINSGTRLPWDPTINAQVQNVVSVGGTIFITGDFDSVNYKTVPYGIASFSQKTGGMLDWSPTSYCSKMAKAGNSLIMVLGPKAPTQKDSVSIVCLEPIKKTIMWSLKTVGPIIDLTSDDNFLFAAGYFSTIGGRTTNGVAKIDLQTGKVADWSTDLRLGNLVRISSHGHILFMAGNYRKDSVYGEIGSYSAVDKQTGHFIKKWRAITDLEVYLNGGFSEFVAPFGKYVLVAGGFNSIGGAYTPSGMASIDLKTGRYVKWGPDTMSGYGLVQMIGYNNKIYMAFTGPVKINGQERKYLAALDPISSKLLPWNSGTVFPNDNGNISFIRVYKDKIYFPFKLKQDTLQIASVDTGVGKLKMYTPIITGRLSTSPMINDLAVYKNKLYIAGSFRYVDSKPRSCLASMDLKNETLLKWNPNPTRTESQREPEIDRILCGRNKVFVQGSYDTIGGRALQDLAGLDTSVGKAIFWPKQKQIRIHHENMNFYNGRILLGNPYFELLDTALGSFTTGSYSLAEGIIPTAASGAFFSTGYDRQPYYNKLLFSYKPCVGYMQLTGEEFVCPSSIYDYMISPKAGINYNWNITGGTILNGQNTDKINVIWDSTEIGIVRVVATNSSGCRDTITQVVEIDSVCRKIPNAISQISPKSIQVYPNPFTGQLTVTGKISRSTTVKMFDLLGREVPATYLAEDSRLTISTDSFPKGMYLLVLVNGGQITIKKVMRL